MNRRSATTTVVINVMQTHNMINVYAISGGSKNLDSIPAGGFSAGSSSEMFCRLEFIKYKADRDRVLGPGITSEFHREREEGRALVLEFCAHP